MTIEKFIKRLEQISENKKKLPLVMFAPNGMECDPQIKMMTKDNMLFGGVEKMCITWRD